MGANNIFCPEYKCEQTVDESILLTFINVFEVLNMKRRAKDNMFQCSEYTKWCPNPQCGRIIKVNKPKMSHASVELLFVFSVSRNRTGQSRVKWHHFTGIK
jgi:hypothetical protein